MPGVTFPTGTISFADIRNCLAGNNTAGAQTPVSLNDLPVRYAASSINGQVAISSLRGVNVLFSGTITVGQTYNGATWTYGYEKVPDGGPVVVGALGTTSYYKLPTKTDGSAAELQAFEYVYSPQSTSLPISTVVRFSPVVFATDTYIYVSINGQKIFLNNSFMGNTWNWQTKNNVFGLENMVGGTYPVVITY